MGGLYPNPVFPSLEHALINTFLADGNEAQIRIPFKN
jgi:hypothetical protein